ncbi:hypothetical protein XENOCAPTIV_001757 [Xenoophorus captivus]|uniref:Uncharacterized protein n=1 Tax=Xenoophorus captivus TaxID=1517983 RepID=A0ABV0QPB1_9TELE
MSGTEKMREGRGLSFISSALLSDSKLAHLFSLLFVAYIQFFPLLSFCTFALPHGLESDIHAVLAHNLGHSGSGSLHSCIFLCFSVFLLLILDFGCCSAFIAPFWSLRQQSASD